MLVNGVLCCPNRLFRAPAMAEGNIVTLRPIRTEKSRLLVRPRWPDVNDTSWQSWFLVLVEDGARERPTAFIVECIAECEALPQTGEDDRISSVFNAQPTDDIVKGLRTLYYILSGLDRK